MKGLLTQVSRHIWSQSHENNVVEEQKQTVRSVEQMKEPNMSMQNQPSNKEVE